MADNSESPRIIQRHCGGWLAHSGEGEPLKIGVTADSEEEAREKYREAMAAWRDNLSQGENHVGHTHI